MKIIGRSAAQRVDLRTFLKRNRRRTLLWLTLGLCVAALLIAADRAGLLLYPGDDWQRYHNKTFRVTQVIDGDTIDLDCPDHRSPSHLLAVLAPLTGPSPQSTGTTAPL
jgi:hypothetical protein